MVYMIKDYTNLTLENRGINSKYFLVCQLWRELTDKRTFDSYQFKSVNVISGIAELLHNIDAYLDKSVPTTHLIVSSSEELVSIVNSDPVMRKSFPTIRNRLLALLGKKTDTDAKIKSVKYQLTLHQQSLSRDYDTALIESLLQAVDDNNTYNIIATTSTFMSRCADHGWSTDALSNRLDKGLREGKTLEDILTSISNAADQNYAILFQNRLNITPPIGRTRETSDSYICEQLSQFGISVYTAEEICGMYPQIRKSDINTNVKYMQVTCSAKDVYSASHSGVLKLSGVLDMLSFFSAIKPWSISNNCWVAYNIDSPYTKKLSASDIYRTYEYLDSSTAVYNRLARLLNTQGDSSDLYQKLTSSFSYANLSRTSMSIEEKYMNMWIALEALVRTDAYDNIIGNILECVADASVLRYFYKQVRNFIEDCKRCSLSLDFGEVKIDVGNCNKEELVECMLNVMRDPVLQSDLATRCQCCDLLYARCQNIIEISCSPVGLINHIKKHHKNVEWHLNRLYRIRNEIAHAALQQDVSIIKYTEHIYDYLSTYIAEIIRVAAEMDSAEFGVLSAAINNNYQEFKYISDEKSLKPKEVFLGSLWKTGVMNFL